MLRCRQVGLPAALVLLACILVARSSRAQVGFDDLPIQRTDHSKVVQTFGLRYFPVAIVPAHPRPVMYPMGGGRYWFNNMIGFEAGLGAAIGTDAANTSIQIGGTIGLPVLLADGRHVTGIVRPFVSVFRLCDEPVFQFGADVAVDWHLSFFGIPQLALELGFGVKATTYADKVLLIDTSVGPRYRLEHIFLGMLSFIYYFAPG